MQPRIYHASAHDIDHSFIDSDAIHVIRKLNDAGFRAYLVGGSVRDLLTKKNPKDFDISTSAKPEEIKGIFRKHCLLIGKRFRLAHIRFGHKIFEVATFRSGENDSDLIVHDNMWGSEEEDVTRRDFTINGLLYDPTSRSVIDYVGGWDDIHAGLLRTIGDPLMRFRQDPVRMLRLLKFRARFGFNLDPSAKAALFACREEVIKSSPARILEEILRMLESGSAAPFFSLMSEANFIEMLFPNLTKPIKGEQRKEIFLLLSAADKWNRRHQKSLLDRSILAACLLYPIFVSNLKNEFLNNGVTPHLGEIIMSSGSVVKEQLNSSFLHFPKRISATTNFILANQYRLTPLTTRRHHRQKIVHHKEFEFAIKFLMLRSMVDSSLEETYQAWKNISKSQDKRHSESRYH